MCKYPVWTLFILGKHVSGVIIYPPVCICFAEVGHDTGDTDKHVIDIHLQCYNEEKELFG